MNTDDTIKLKDILGYEEMKGCGYCRHLNVPEQALPNTCGLLHKSISFRVDNDHKCKMFNRK